LFCDGYSSIFSLRAVNVATFFFEIVQKKSMEVRIGWDLPQIRVNMCKRAMIGTPFPVTSRPDWLWNFEHSTLHSTKLICNQHFSISMYSTSRQEILEHNAGWRKGVRAWSWGNYGSMRIGWWKYLDCHQTFEVELSTFPGSNTGKPRKLVFRLTCVCLCVRKSLAVDILRTSRPIQKKILDYVAISL